MDEHRTIISAADFDRLLAELDRPPVVIPSLAEAARKARFIQRG